MKRVGNLYQKIYEPSNLLLAYKNARKGKGWYREVKVVEKNVDYYLNQLHIILKEEKFDTSEYKIYTINDGRKDREVYKLPFYPDRICQWAIMQVIQPILMNKISTDTYSAIPKRGIHKVVKKMKKTLFNNDVKYCLKFDIKKYYPSIDQTILMSKLTTIFKDKALLSLLENIISSVSPDKGIPIGNYLSQWFGNLYLSDFDRWVKQERVQHYFRYMDDVVIIHEDKEYLHQLFLEIKQYLQNNLNLTIKNNWQIFPMSKGIDFVGYRFFVGYTLVRKSIVKNFKVAIKKDATSSMLSIPSYKGWFDWGDCFRLTSKYGIEHGHN